MLAEFWHTSPRTAGALIGLAFFSCSSWPPSSRPLIAPHAPNVQNREAILLPPAWSEGGNLGFLLGTDAVGRDIFSRLLTAPAFRSSSAVVVVVLALTTGIFIGLIAGFFRGWDRHRDHAHDGHHPGLPVAPARACARSPCSARPHQRDDRHCASCLSRTSSASPARVMAEKGKDYVVSARVAGAGPIRLMTRTILPNCLAPLIVQATLSFSNAILDAAALGFLGHGRPAAHAGMGHHARRSPRIHPACLVGGDRSPASRSSSPSSRSTSSATACATHSTRSSSGAEAVDPALGRAGDRRGDLSSLVTVASWFVSQRADRQRRLSADVIAFRMFSGPTR
jgi:dipeptide transport system permease protein